jgi:hypothetical protein
LLRELIDIPGRLAVNVKMHVDVAIAVIVRVSAFRAVNVGQVNCDFPIAGLLGGAHETGSL